MGGFWVCFDMFWSGLIPTSELLVVSCASLDQGLCRFSRPTRSQPGLFRIIIRDVTEDVPLILEQLDIVGHLTRQRVISVRCSEYPKVKEDEPLLAIFSKKYLFFFSKTNCNKLLEILHHHPKTPWPGFPSPRPIRTMSLISDLLSGMVPAAPSSSWLLHWASQLVLMSL